MENVSTLMDGELGGDEAGREIIRLTADSSFRETWDTYHLIGDAIRGAAPVARGFGPRFSERLALEPTVLAPHTNVTRRFTHKAQTYALSAAASVAAVAVVGWMALNMLQPDEAGGPNAPAAQLAKAPVPAVVSQPQAVTASVTPAVMSQPQAVAASVAPVAAPVEHVQEYLLAHQGISPTTAIQGVTPYIRTVSSTGD